MIPPPEDSDALDQLWNAQQAVYASSLNNNPKLYLHFITTGTYRESKQLSKLNQNQKKNLQDLNIFADVNLLFEDGATIQEAYRAANRSNRGEINTEKIVALPQHTDVKEAYLGYVNATEIINLVTKPDGETLDRHIFFDNIRDFDTNSEINKSIEQSLLNSDASEFIFKNNGITIVAKNIHRTGDKFNITDFQIVNGCQTTSVLYQIKEKIENVQIPLRLIASDKNDFISKVILGTNSQNTIKPEQLWALKPFLKELEEFFQNKREADLRLERRAHQYQSSGEEKTRIIQLKELVKSTVAIFFDKPHMAARDWRKIKTENEKDLFIQGQAPLAYWAAAYASYQFDYLIRNEKSVDSSFKLYKYFIIYFLAAEHGIIKRDLQVSRDGTDRLNKFIKFINNRNDFKIRCVNLANEIESFLVDTHMSHTTSKSREEMRDAVRQQAFYDALVKTRSKPINKNN